MHIYLYILADTHPKDLAHYDMMGRYLIEPCKYFQNLLELNLLQTQAGGRR